MRIEYPEYYNRFRCVADACQDTCCAGWEVDIDEDTYYYYQVVPGTFGERLRAAMAEDGEGHWFPMTCDNRCPFLDDRGLCDIYANLGEESLSRVCTEYPRYYMEIGDYEQIDMSLSCMELGRILFTETPRITYITEENDACPEEDLAPADAARLHGILAQRDAMIAAMQSGEGTYTERLTAAIEIACPAGGLPAESDADLLRVLDECEAINDGWYETLASLHTIVETAGDKPVAALTDARYDEYLTKLAIYLIYRYSVDSYLDGDDHIDERTLRLITRSLRMIELMCAIRAAANGGIFTAEDMIDIAHRFSKEIEHSDDNIERIKN